MHNYGRESKAREWDNTHMCERYVVDTLLTYFLVNSNFCFEQLFTRITDHHKLVVEVCEGVVVVVFLWIYGSTMWWTLWAESKFNYFWWWYSRCSPGSSLTSARDPAHWPMQDRGTYRTYDPAPAYSDPMSWRLCSLVLPCLTLLRRLVVSWTTAETGARSLTCPPFCTCHYMRINWRTYMVINQYTNPTSSSAKLSGADVVVVELSFSSVALR